MTLLKLGTRTVNMDLVAWIDRGGSNDAPTYSIHFVGRTQSEAVKDDGAVVLTEFLEANGGGGREGSHRR